MKRIILIITLALLTFISCAAQKVVADVAVRDNEGRLVEYYSNVDIISYKEASNGALLNIRFRTPLGKEYYLEGGNISVEGVGVGEETTTTVVVERPTTRVYVAPTYVPYVYRPSYYRHYYNYNRYHRPTPPPPHHNGVVPHQPHRPHQPAARPPQSHNNYHQPHRGMPPSHHSGRRY